MKTVWCVFAGNDFVTDTLLAIYSTEKAARDEAITLKKENPNVGLEYYIEEIEVED